MKSLRFIAATVPKSRVKSSAKVSFSSSNNIFISSFFLSNSFSTSSYHNKFYHFSSFNQLQTSTTSTATTSSTTINEVTQAKNLLKEGFNKFESKQYLKSYETFLKAFQLFEKNNLISRPIKLEDNFTTVDTILALAIGLNNYAETLRYMTKGGIVPTPLSSLGIKPNTNATFVYTLKDPMKFYLQAENLYNQYQKYLEGKKKQEGDKWDKQRKELELSLWKGTLYNNVGLYCMENMRDYAGAVKWFEKAADIRGNLITSLEKEQQGIVEGKEEEERNEFEESKDPLNVKDIKVHYAITRNNIAQCFTNSRQISAALENFNYCLKVFEDIKQNAKDQSPTPENKNTIANRLHVIVLNNMGLMYHELAKYEEALTYFTEAFYLFTGGPVQGETPNEKGLIINNQKGTAFFSEELGVTLSNLATSLFMLGRYRESEQFFQQALQLFDIVYETTPNHKNIAQVCLQYALCLKQKHSAKEGEKPDRSMLSSATSLALTNKDSSFFLKSDKDDTNEKKEDEKKVKDLLERAKKITNALSEVSKTSDSNQKKSLTSRLLGKNK
ncbi:hypothetical protein ABK040_014092 [Willaertia magna]